MLCFLLFFSFTASTDSTCHHTTATCSSRIVSSRPSKDRKALPVLTSCGDVDEAHRALAGVGSSRPSCGEVRNWREDEKKLIEKKKTTFCWRKPITDTHDKSFYFLIVKVLLKKVNHIPTFHGGSQTTLQIWSIDEMIELMRKSLSFFKSKFYDSNGYLKHVFMIFTIYQRQTNTAKTIETSAKKRKKSQKIGKTDNK